MATASRFSTMARLDTDTPATSTPELEPARIARLGDRFLGLLIDTLPLAGLSFFLTFSLGRIHGSLLSGLSSGSELTWLSFAFLALASFLYFSAFEGTCGFTMGKAMVGIRVQLSGGDRCNLQASLIRNLFRLIDGQAAYLLAFFIASFSTARQRLGDHLAGTVVVEQEISTRWRLAISIVWALITSLSLYYAFLLHRDFAPPLR